MSTPLMQRASSRETDSEAETHTIVIEYWSRLADNADTSPTFIMEGD